MGFEKLSGAWDFFLYSINFPVFKARIGDSSLKTLVFVGEHLPPRIPRMAKWLKRKYKYRIVLLCSHAGYTPAFANNSIDYTFLFRNPVHLRRILRTLPPIWVMHSFAPKSHFGNIAREMLPQVQFIHDMQDVLATYYGTNPETRWLKQELPHEKSCLENADGVISHSMEVNEGFRRYKISKKPPSLFFPLYCDGDSFLNIEKKTGEEIHLVYAGGVAGSHRDAKHYGNTQFGQLIKKLTSQGLHFHIYPSPTNVRADYEEYEILSKENPLFHFHAPVPQEKLSAELSRYHFGLLPFFKELSEQSAAKLKFATTLKLFNYLEAGLPVIVSKDLGFQSWIIERYGAGMGIELRDIESLGNLLRQRDYSIIQQKVIQAREKLSLAKNIHRLDDFYSLVKNSAKPR
ncbi:MAG: hypothetical protein M3R17_15370 [Bacteroidota bacterium]|nr:hypothetical protein [Bacteroidota bacterium]